MFYNPIFVESYEQPSVSLDDYLIGMMLQRREQERQLQMREELARIEAYRQQQQEALRIQKALEYMNHMNQMNELYRQRQEEERAMKAYYMYQLKLQEEAEKERRLAQLRLQEERRLAQLKLQDERRMAQLKLQKEQEERNAAMFSAVFDPLSSFSVDSIPAAFFRVLQDIQEEEANDDPMSDSEEEATDNEMEEQPEMTEDGSDTTKDKSNVTENVSVVAPMEEDPVLHNQAESSNTVDSAMTDTVDEPTAPVADTEDIPTTVDELIGPVADTEYVPTTVDELIGPVADTEEVLVKLDTVGDNEDAAMVELCDNTIIDDISAQEVDDGAMSDDSSVEFTEDIPINDADILAKLNILKDIECQLNDINRKYEHDLLQSTLDFTAAHPDTPITVLAISNNNKKFLEYEDTIMKLLMKTDAVESNGNIIIRRKRKSIVRLADKMLETLDTFKQKEWERHSDGGSVNNE